ncbi:MAG: hypothetical protein E7523_10975 [Ruminococcaceae bacterium]|nr:hypothetical protein [Oscillospiraceae bacterium]
MNELQLKQCDVQGRLFELSAESQLNSAAFVKAFMSSHVAKGLDSKFNHMQWAGEEYLLDELTDSVGIENLTKNAEILSKDVLYWMGYIYRFWHFYTGEDSAKIYKQAPFATMKRNYMMFHTMAPELAVDDLKEIYNQS